MSDYKTIKYVETFDGDYGSLVNTPTIPSAVSDLSNDTGFITSSSLPTAVSELTNDSGYLTTAPAPTTAQVLTATAGLTAGAVGTHVTAIKVPNGTVELGDTQSGSGIKPCNSQGGPAGNALSGTWRSLGKTNGDNGASSTTLFIRIS